MTSNLEFHHDVGDVWQSYSRALPLPGSTPKRLNPSAIPLLQGNLYGAISDPAAVKRYAELCGFRIHLLCPVTWPHILAFPLQLRLLTDPSFPLPLLGLIHMQNRVIQHRDLHLGEYPDIHCRIANPAVTPKGLTFDLCTDVFSSGKLIWEEVSTTLYRYPSTQRTKKAAGKPVGALPRYAKTRTLPVSESTGRRYGRVSGDLNPIHLHSLSAKLFGFPRAIAHGMWSKAHCLALLQRQPDWYTGPLEVAVAFKKPLFLPGKATLNWESHDQGMDFQLLNDKATVPHLTGQVRWLAQ